VIGLAALGALLAAPRAVAQDFGDFEVVGRLEDARRQPTPLTVGGHSFEPSITYKLLGITTPHVFGALSGGYTDNLLREDEETPNTTFVRETYGRAEAGVRLDTSLLDHRLELDYRAAVTEYSRTGAFDAAEHRLRARADFIFNDASAHLDGGYARSAYAQSIQLRGLVRLDTYTASAFAEARWNRFGGRVGVTGRRLDYLERGLANLDHRGFGANVQAYYRVSPKLRALVEYNFDSVRFFDRPDLDGYDVHQVRGGLDGEITPKLSASVKLGAAFQQTHADGPNPDDREFGGFTAAISARWDVLPRTKLTGTYRRSIDPSLNSAYLLTDDVELSVGQALFDEKVNGSAFVGYTHSTVSPGEHLNRLRAGASLTYLIRQWLSVSASYQWERFNSAFPFSDYDAHTVSVSVGVGL
jgi:hypothetical protein